MKIDRSKDEIISRELVPRRSRTVTMEPSTVRRVGSVVVVLVMTAVAFAGLTQAPGDTDLYLSDRIAFFDNFEDSGSGGFDWGVDEGPPPNEFGPVSGYNARGQFDLPGNWAVRMFGDENVQGVAYGVSPGFLLVPEGNYIITLDLMIPQPSYPGDYEGWFTVVDDGNIWLIIDGEYDSEHWSLTTSWRKGQIMDPLEPLSYNKWYHIECRVHLFESEYDIYLNGDFKGTQGFDRGLGNWATGFVIIGDTSPEADSYGEAYWDNILFAHLEDFPWSDEIGEDIDDWTRVVTEMNYFGTWTGELVGRPPGSHVLRMLFQGTGPPYPPDEARGFTPYYDTFPEEGYVLSFWFRVEDWTDSEFTLVDDGRIWLKLRRDDEGFDLIAYINDDNTLEISPIEPLTWHNIVCRVNVTNEFYHIYFGDSYQGSSAFSEFEESYFVRPMTPNNLFLGAKGNGSFGLAEAYWDDFIFHQDSDGDGLTDLEEVQGYNGQPPTDPFDPDSDDDNLLDSTEVGLGGYDRDPSTTTDPHDQDTDDDGIFDGTEDWNKDGDWNNVPLKLTETSPNHLDSDEDGLTDGQEIGLSEPEGSGLDTDLSIFREDEDEGETTTDPLDNDSDDDGLPDGRVDGWVDNQTNGNWDFGEFEDLDLDGEVDSGEYGSTPSMGETDPNSDDTDEDYLQDIEEVCNGEDCTYVSNPLLPDTDSDGLPDDWEVEKGTFVQIPDAQENYDEDTFDNEREYQEGSDPLSGDTDFDLILDSEDDNILDYNIKNEPDNIFESVDTSKRLEFDVEGFTYHVSIAVDYVIPSKDPVMVSTSMVENGDLNSVIVKFHFETDYQLDYEAVIKIGYGEDCLGDVDERHLLMYYYIGDLGSEPHWTLPINPTLSEETGRDLQDDYVWVKTSRLGDYAIADATQNDVNGDGRSDGEQLNIIAYDPTITTLCKSDQWSDCIIEDGDLNGDEEPDPAYERWYWTGDDGMDFGDGGDGNDVTMYLRVWLEEGAYEEVEIHTDWSPPTPRVRVEGEYGVAETPFIEYTDAIMTEEDIIKGNDYHAQSFIFTDSDPSSSSIKCGRFEIMVSRTWDIPQDYLKIGIWDDNGDEPGDHLGSAWVEKSPSEFSRTPTWEYAELASPIVLNEIETYWIVASSDYSLGDGGYMWEFGAGYEDGHKAKSYDAGETWENDPWEEHEDFLFRLYEKSQPKDPSLNVKSAEGDTTIDWQYSGILRTPITISDALEDTHISGDMNTFLGAEQSICGPSGCVATKGYVLIPFVFHSDSPGQLWIPLWAEGRSIHVIVSAKEFEVQEILEQDGDGDGLSDDIEDLYFCTDPSDDDSDDDGLTDGEEIRVYGTDPCNADSDGDGLSDPVEVLTYLTDPWLSDTDSDGLSDGEEIFIGFEPTTNGHDIDYIKGDHYHAQSISIRETVDLVAVKMHLSKIGSPEDWLKIQIWKDDNGKPDKGELDGFFWTGILPGVAWIDRNEVPQAPGTDWLLTEFELGPIVLEEDPSGDPITYWIVATSEGSINGGFDWLVNTAGTYPGGFIAESDDEGINWYVDTNLDFGFIAYAEQYRTDPFDPDTDRDGWLDGEDPKPLYRNPFKYWGFTWHFPQSWIRTSCRFPHDRCVDTEWQIMWDYYIKPTHARVIRNDINVMAAVGKDGNDQLFLTEHGDTAIKKWTHLAIWAKNNDAYLMPILGGTEDWDMMWVLFGWVVDPSCHKDLWFIERVRYLVKELASSILEKDPEAYKRIIAYQVENEINHDLALGPLWSPLPDAGGHHDFWLEDWEINLLAGGSEAIRLGEEDAELETGVSLDSPTPIMMNPSYDWFIWGPLGGNSYTEMKIYIEKVLTDSRNKIDVIGLDYYPASWVPLDDEWDLREVVRKLSENFGLGTGYNKEIIVAETGFHTFGRPNSHQENYYETLTGHLKDYYHENSQEGKNRGFRGVMWYEFTSSDDFWGGLEKYWGIIRKNTDGTVNYCKDAWYWLVDDLLP